MRKLSAIMLILLVMQVLSACNDVSRWADCLDGCSNFIGPQGPPGPKGDKGDPGIPGTSCTAQLVSGGVNVKCGSNAPVFVSNGVNGTNGAQGPQGLPGIPGTSCTVTTLLPSQDNPTGGARIDCGTSSAIVINGAASGDASAYAIVGSVDPCGPSGGWDEIFLRMASGDLVALFVENSSALTARLVYIRDGINLTTTDNQHCNFNVQTNSSGLRTITYTSSVVSGSPTSESWQTY